jgi:endonuclease/exonuclease/phosphatase family metal-dependent hydrolase
MRSGILLSVILALVLTSPADAAEPLRLRILSYNIHHGRGTDDKVDLERIAGVIRSCEPDLVALQEVDKGVERTQGVDEPAELARLTKMNVVFGNNIVYQGGDYGNAVLSRFPVAAHKNHKLPVFYKNEQRGVMEVDVTLGDGHGTLVFMATHLDYRGDSPERLPSATLINELIARPVEPAILAGDLNDMPDSKTLAEFEKSWKRTNEGTLATFPVDKPTRQIDHILVRPADRWQIIEVKVLDEAIASDHRPILAVLELKAAD